MVTSLITSYVYYVFPVTLWEMSLHWFVSALVPRSVTRPGSVERFLSCMSSHMVPQMTVPEKSSTTLRAAVRGPDDGIIYFTFKVIIMYQTCLTFAVLLPEVAVDAVITSCRFVVRAANRFLTSRFMFWDFNIFWAKFVALIITVAARSVTVTLRDLVIGAAKWFTAPQVGFYQVCTQLLSGSFQRISVGFRRVWRLVVSIRL